MTGISDIKKSVIPFLKGAIVSATVTLLLKLLAHIHADPSRTVIAKWSAAQWLPLPVAYRWQEEAWKHWEKEFSLNATYGGTIREMPFVNVQEFQENVTNLLLFLDFRWGKDWRTRPLLLKGLWDAKELQSNTSRRLSRSGLLQEELVIPYFTDAREYGALSPNAKAPVKDIIANITKGDPLKIGTQLLIQKFPELVNEVAPIHILTRLFGDRFSPKEVERGAFGIPFLPALTTVPLFVAASTPTSSNNNDIDNQQCNAFTALHCEPIGNVAVQLEGSKRWTLVSPHFSFRLKPTASPDGRAFFASAASSEDEIGKVPRYYTETQAGDAVWVPPWFWHRVDYTTSSTSPNTDNADGDGNAHNVKLAIGASLFHLRPEEFVRNNPLFAFLIIPNLVKEIFRFKTQ